ncbi:MAG: alpha-glucosidase [Atopobiaceae bacterium]|jgi:alpha-glucosidase|nr:alpha-glucosidase [Atopobiaceae bacterium]MCH4179928.1 alpha-glucosidase [Atopobiaceae bacterium]MCH4213679.1 alpha-glucosidase [Atopobiaceae bacterium]MCH4230206.1 alpha-glucosidase [Atopobiaceae bacterium]MCH4275964.1 alpha-glucosidase [Atopobiaceae bacterium]
MSDSLKWWQRTIVYEVYPKSFLDTRGQGTGTIQGITSKLDHLASLGVGAAWLTPVYASPMVDNGYDVADYYAIDPSFGTMADMDELIARAGERGIRIVMDLVFNHTSDQNSWFVDSASSPTAEHADWYIWRDARPDGSAPTNWRSIFGGSAWEWCEARQQYYLHTFAPQQPDLNWANPRVRSALFDVANFWADKGVGGFRVDAVTYIRKPDEFRDGTPDADDGMVRIHDMTANTPGILDYLHEFKDAVCDGRDIFTVGEANGVVASDLPLWVGDDGVFDMVFEFSHMHVPMGSAEVWYEAPAWRLTELKAALAASQANTATTGWYPIFFENHDQPRSPSNFLPAGVDPALAAKVLATVLLTLRGTPFVYQGEELGYTNVAWPSIDDYDDVSSASQYASAIAAGLTADEALRCVHRFSRDNARTPLQWTDGSHAGFSTGTPWLPVHDDYATDNVEAQDAQKASVLSWYRRLVALRASHEELVSGDYVELMPASEQVLAFQRTAGARKAVVLANLSDEDAPYEASLVDGMGLLASTYGDSLAGTLRPLESVVFEA